jgi:ATP-binding cassette subfamily B protein
VFGHLQVLPMDCFSRAQVGDIVVRFSSDMAVVETAIVRSLPKGVAAILHAVACGVLPVCIDWRLTVVTVCAFPLTVVGQHMFGTRAARAPRRMKRLL